MSKRTRAVSTLSEQEQQWKSDRRAALEWARAVYHGSQFVLLDTETTGLEPASDAHKTPHFYGHEVIQLAIIEGVEGTVRANTLIVAQEYEAIDPKAFEVHGITNEMLMAPNVPLFTEVWQQHLRPLFDEKGTIILTWGAEFDIQLIAQTARRYGLVLPEEKLVNRVHCMMERFAAFRGESPSKDRPGQKYKWYSLERAARYFEVPLPITRHRALEDCQLALAVLKKLVEEKI